MTSYLGRVAARARGDVVGAVRPRPASRFEGVGAATEAEPVEVAPGERRVDPPRPVPLVPTAPTSAGTPEEIAAPPAQPPVRPAAREARRHDVVVGTDERPAAAAAAPRVETRHTEVVVQRAAPAPATVHIESRHRVVEREVAPARDTTVVPTLVAPPALVAAVAGPHLHDAPAQPVPSRRAETDDARDERPPVVHVTIGRVEIRTRAPAGARRPAPVQEHAGSTLDAYLEQRRRGALS